MRKLATIRTIKSILPIEGADRIELAVVDGWKCVIKKGEFSEGDSVVYCEIDSFLPIREEFEFLRKSSFKKMGDDEGFRLRTVKLRGQISQGLLIDPAVLNRECSVGEDVTAELGILKYEPPIPACLTGSVVGPFPSAISKTDEERIQNLASDYGSYQNKPFFVSEKLDGLHSPHFSTRNLECVVVTGNMQRTKRTAIGRPLTIWAFVKRCQSSGVDWRYKENC